MKKILAIMLGMIMIFALAGCGENNNAGGAGSKAGDTSDGNGGQTSDVPQMTVYIDIDYPDNSGVKDVEDLKMQVVKGSSVLTVLNDYAAANSCEVLMSDNSATAYVTSIGGVAATDAAGWVYEVNDQMVMDAADAYILEDGDEVSWDFETWGE